jgi:hypothetical protein
MGWLQSINYACKICGNQYMIKEEAENCFDRHNLNENIKTSNSFIKSI